MPRFGATYDGSVAAVPWAAAVVLLLARVLPVEFAYRANDLGIVSIVSRLGYPKQQETFWLLFGVGVGAVGVALLARAFRAGRMGFGDVVGLEATGFAALAALLLLPGWAGLVAVALCGGGAFRLRSRMGRAVADPSGSDAAPGAAADLRGSVLCWLPAMLAVALLVTPSIWVHVWNVVRAVPDAELAHDNFKFLAETGQHLAWANSLYHGGLHGRDFFCLYGPFYDLGIVWFWSLFGRSVAATGLYLATIRIAAWVCLLATVALLVRRRWLILLAPFLLPFVKLRVGLALAAFCCLVLWLRTARDRWAFASGCVAGVSLFFSQEYGIAFLIAAALGFAVRRETSAVALFAGGLACVAAPTLGYYAWHGALGPMLRDVLTYPGYVMAGYANMPYPSLLAALPFDPGELASRSTAFTRLAYAVPSVCVAGIALASGVAEWDLRRPLASLRELVARLARDPERLAVLLLAVFSVISFRSALGRSDLSHLQAVMPAVVVLLCVAADRILGAWSAGGARRRVALARGAMLAAFLGIGGFVQIAAPLDDAAQSLRIATNLVRTGYRPAGSRRILRTVRWVQLNTRPGEPVLFLPNDAAYYYLVDRPNPIRFVVAPQIVGDDHRREVLADLERNPPRYVVWDRASLVVDDIPHDLVLGEGITRFLEERYELETQLGTFDILRRIGAPAG